MATQEDTHGIQDPPQTIRGILGRIGPGLIITASIVGSGELIATTAVGAEAGFWLLWLIIIGCVIKVFVQVELGRHTIISGRTSLDNLNSVPGPRIARGNWILWYGFFMYVAILFQMGGIVGAVGQSMAISFPLTETGRKYNEVLDAETELQVQKRYLALVTERPADDEPARLSEAAAERQAAEIRASIDSLNEKLTTLGEKPENPYDDRTWAVILSVLTAGLLLIGRYGFIQTFSVVLVAAFTVVTLINLILLQSDPTLAISVREFTDGFRFRLPPSTDGTSSVAGLGTALATFGIIGVGGSELVTYPYWCLEKGYARFTGPRDDSPEWAARASGWMRVLRWDAWCSLVIYTFATVVFYLLGAATLGRFELDAKGTALIRTLAVMYEPVFGVFALWLFLAGAFAVLYSTFFVGLAGNARVFSDALYVLRLGIKTQAGKLKLVTVLSGLLPLMAVATYLLFQKPKFAVLTAGAMQALFLPMLAAAALYFRYRRSDRRLLPGRLWGFFLWVSAIGMFITASALLNELLGG